MTNKLTYSNVEKILYDFIYLIEVPNFLFQIADND